jgi:DNA-binding response OmpR family regulator
MARSVLVVEPDLDALGELASKLRGLGLTVLLADDVNTALERLRTTRADAVLFSDRLEDLPGALAKLESTRELAAVVPFVLGSSTADGPVSSRQPVPPDILTLPREAPEAIAQRLHALSRRHSLVPSMRDDFRGELQQVGVVDLVQLLAMNRRTGVLSLVTPAGAGELRIRDGEVVDALYRRLEAEKALYRLLAENAGTFAFTSGQVTGEGRIATPTNVLLMEGLRQVDEVRRLRDSLGVEDDAALAIVAPAPDDAEARRRVLLALSVPRTVDELLEEVPLADHEVLQAFAELLEGGEVRRIPKGAARVPLAEPEQLAVLGAMVNRLRVPGYTGPVRLVIAGKPRRLGTVTHALQRIADATSPADAQPPLPIPFPMATLRIGDAAELSVVGVPVVDAYSPLWSLALPGAAVVVRLDDTTSMALDRACAVADVPALDAAALMGQVDDADPNALAALLRLALETVAGD